LAFTEHITKQIMKTKIFKEAILRRNKIRFVYGIETIILEPYFISVTKEGKKVIYGKVNNSNQIKSFYYDKIFNIKLLKKKKFSPIIPILPFLN